MINYKVFLSQDIFNLAKERATLRIGTVEPYRLFCNLLSSMPMCFNLFSDLRKLLIYNKAEATRLVQSMFQEIDWIDEVLYIDVEFIPLARDSSRGRCPRSNGERGRRSRGWHRAGT